jgi:hypothetical protein
MSPAEVEIAIDIELGACSSNVDRRMSNVRGADHGVTGSLDHAAVQNLQGAW